MMRFRDGDTAEAATAADVVETHGNDEGRAGRPQNYVN